MLRRVRQRSAECPSFTVSFSIARLTARLSSCKPARDLDGPALVAKIALDLADDRRRRVRREFDAALEIEAVDRLEQTDRSDLDQIVERLAAIGKLDREIAHQVEVRDDQVAAQPLVFASAPA